MFDRLEDILIHFEELQAELSNPEVINTVSLLLFLPGNVPEYIDPPVLYRHIIPGRFQVSAYRRYFVLLPEWHLKPSTLRIG